MKNVKGIEIVKMEAMDVIRHDVVARIVEAYDRYEERQRDE